MKILNSLHKIKKWYKLIDRHHDKVDIGRRYTLPSFTKLKYNLLGFTEQEYFEFDLEKNDYHQYISCWERVRLENINGRFAYFLGEKVTFERFFGRSVHVPHIYAWIHMGTAIDPETGETVDLPEAIKGQRILIAKPSRSVGGGSGVKRLEYKEGCFFSNGERITEDQLRKNLWRIEDYLFVETVQQADYARSIFPGSCNSFRVVTGRHKNGEIEVLHAFHRFGCDQSVPVDNISSGGLFAVIQSDGVMTAAKRLTEIGEWYSVHPDTGVQIEGIRIPGWEEITDALLRVHKTFPYYKFFAWDVVIGQDGCPWILEINRGCDLYTQSIHPLRNEKFGAFMREYGLLDKKLDP